MRNRIVVAVVTAVVLALAGAGTAVAQSQVVPLATDCSGTKLELHNGFQEAPRCVETSHGEVSEFAKNPQLIITDAPERVRQGQDFALKVSTRNLVRDRFLAAAQGGYYLETGLLDANGLTRGHFHVGCRVLEDRGQLAPAPERSPFFVAVEDGKGGAAPDTVKVVVKGQDANGKALFRRGALVQCMAWAGDGSHRVPLMQFANEMIAVDAVRIRVR